MLGAVVLVLGGFGFLVWRSYRTGLRRYEALRKIGEEGRNPSAPG